MSYESKFVPIKENEDLASIEKEEPSFDENEGNENTVENKEVVNSVIDDCLNSMKSGEEVAKALRNIGQESFDKGLQQRELAWEQAVNSIARLQTFEHLENAPDEKVEEEYLKYFESQNSDLSLGKILVSLDSVSTRAGFFNVYNNRQSELPQNILKTARIAEKLVGASKRLKKRQEKLD